jgi:long-subunit fatty acid transport protein
MHKIAPIGFLVVLLTNLCFGNDIPERLLLSSGINIGSGARALGLGGTYTGIADDFSAVWWNPAGLSQVKRIEMQASIARAGYSNSTNYYGSPFDGSTSGTRLNNLGIVFPVPVYQGALSFAFGYNQVLGYDRRARVLTPYNGTGEWDEFDELESGRLGMWSFVGAMDVSPNLALGMGINYWPGFDEYTFTGTKGSGRPPLEHTEMTVGTDLTGWNVGVGGLFRIGNSFRFGTMLQSPMAMKLKESWTEDNKRGYFTYRMTYPAVVRAGASFCPGRWLLAADIEYRDWTSMQFRSDTPYRDVSKASANQQIKDIYQATTRYSVGGEYLFPMYGVRARAGYSFEPSSYKAAGSEADRNNITLGLGVLVDRSVMLDMTYQLANYTEKTTPDLKEDIKSSTAIFTLSYRL